MLHIILYFFEYLPAGFDLATFKNKLKKLYQEALEYITNLPWNEEYRDERNLKDIYVELEMELVESTHQRRQKVGQVTEGNRVIENEDLVKLKCKTDTDGYEKRVVIKGEVGSGKSCLLGKLAYDWSQDKALSEFELVFLLRLSEIEKGTSLFDAIDKQILDFVNPSNKDHFKMYIKQNSNNLLFLMDSWDETVINLKGESTCVGSDDLTIEAILSNKSLLTSCVLLTTRPHKPVPSMYVAVNLKGFSPDNVKLYIKRFFGDSENADSFDSDSENAESFDSDSENANSLSSGLINKLKQSDLLKAICHIPVMLMLLCIIWEDKQNFPDTVSGLYEEFMLTIWERFCNKPNNEGKKEYHDQLTQFLGHNALSGLLSNSETLEDKVEFHESDLEVHSNLCKLGLSDLCQIGLEVGLITKQRWQFRARQKLIISFLHKSIQELYAARNLAYLFKNDRTQFDQKLSLITSWKLVQNKLEILKFCCGISGNQQETAAVDIIGHVIKKYDEVCNSKNMSANKEALCRSNSEHHVHVEAYIDVGDVDSYFKATDCLPILTLLHEAQLKDNTILPSLFSGSVFSKPMSVDIDCRASQTLMLFHYFLQSVSIAAANIKSIGFYDADSLDLIPDILRHVPHVESLDIKGKYHSKFTGAVGESVAALAHLSSLTLFQTRIDRTDLLRHLSSSPHKSLRHVDFTFTGIGDAISHIGAVMTTHLTCLILYGTDLSESRIEILSKHLPNAPHLQVLDLSGNAIGASISVLTQHLQHCTAMQALRLGNTRLQHNHIETLITFLASWSVYLSELNLSKNAVGGNITGLSNYLQHCRQMEVLRLAYTEMSEKDIEAISALPQTLLKLGLHNNVVGDSLTCLITSLQHCEQLTLLDLKHTHLTDAGVVTLGQHLHHWCHLSGLWLAGNDDVGNSGLHSVLAHIHHLSKLTVFMISATIDRSCSALVRECVHAVGEEIPEGGGRIYILKNRKEQIQAILDLSKAASQAE